MAADCAIIHYDVVILGGMFPWSVKLQAGKVVCRAYYGDGDCSEKRHENYY